MKTRMDEKILVCISYGPNGERLIRRGGKLAAMLNCPLYFLTVDPLPIEEFDAEKTDYINQWKKLAKELKAEEYIIIDNEKRPFVKVVGEVCRQKGITQIIIGQTAHSRWEEITKGSLINQLLRELPFVDIHIVAVARYLEGADDFYEKGIRAYLVKEGDRFRLTFHHTKDVVFEGIFFKETGTDFNNGIFRFMHGKEMLQVQVIDDYVTELRNIHMVGPGSKTEIWEQE